MSPAIADAYVAAGSNVRPRESLRQAIVALSAYFPGLTVSRAWSNAAVGFEGDDFINLVVKFPSDLPVASLLERLKAIERSQGREAGAPKWGPRTLDLDLLLYGDLAGRHAGALLPHPDIATRAWVLGPLAELAPGLVHPASGIPIGELWRRFDRSVHSLRETTLDGPEE